MFFVGQHAIHLFWPTSLWVDRACAHQTDHELKRRQIQALPVFVARSSSMLVSPGCRDKVFVSRLPHALPSAVLFMFVRSMNSGIVTALLVLCLSDLSAVWHLARTYMLGCILSLKPPAHALLRRMHAWLRLVFMCACSQRRGCVCMKVCVCVCVGV